MHPRMILTICRKDLFDAIRGPVEAKAEEEEAAPEGEVPTVGEEGEEGEGEGGAAEGEEA